MELKTLRVAREKAQMEYVAYREALKRNPTVEYVRDLKVAYDHMRRGHPVIDVWQAFADTGLDANGDPKIAVGRADWPHVALTKLEADSARSFQAIFSNEIRWPHQAWRGRTNRLVDMNAKDDVTVPNGTLRFPVDAHGHLTRKELRTKTPVIPARFVPPHGLSNYHILWEVEKWDLVTPPRDPLLLKRISPNVFTVLAAWELTDLERAVVRGRIA